MRYFETINAAQVLAPKKQDDPEQHEAEQQTKVRSDIQKARSRTKKPPR